MSDGFIVTEGVGKVTVDAGDFVVEFNEAQAGITSFRYITNGAIHECVNSSVTPAQLFHPYWLIDGLQGGQFYPAGGQSLDVKINKPQIVQVQQTGYLRNPTLMDITYFPYTVTWTMWPSGRIACRMIVENQSGVSKVLTEEAYRLNPKNDVDITSGRDSAPSLNWFGFWSNNTGGSTLDLSHDVVAVPYQSYLTGYETEGKANQIYREDYTFPNGTSITVEFLLILSVSGSWGDVADSSGFETRGDRLSSDYRNPDPIDGSMNAGIVMVGSKSGDGFDESMAAYMVNAV